MHDLKKAVCDNRAGEPLNAQSNPAHSRSGGRAPVRHAFETHCTCNWARFTPAPALPSWNDLQPVTAVR